MSSLLESLIQQDFGYESRGAKWGRSTKHSSLVHNKEKDIFFWNSRGISGDVKQYLIKVRGYSNADAERSARESVKVCNPVLEKRKIYDTPYDKLVDFLWANGKNKRDYWYKRLLKDDTIDRHRLGFYDGWSTIPLYEDGTFLNFQVRRDIPSKRIRYWYTIKDFSPVLYNAEILEFVDHIYITEGVVDSILLNQLGLPAVSQTGGADYWNPDWFEMFSKIKNIYYIQDNDSAGKHHANIVSNYLGTDKVKISVLGDKEHFDTVDFFAGGGSLEQFRDITSKGKYIFELNRRRYADRIRH